MAIELSFTLFDNIDKLKPVENPSALKAGKFKFTEDGLYSEQIFGPLNNYKCNCGHLFSKENKGLRCEKCGVLCDTNSLRSSTFAKIELPRNIYIILPIFQNLLSNIFGQTAIKSLLNNSKYDDNKQKPYVYSLKQEKLVKLNRVSKEEPIILKEVYDITTLHILYRKMLRNKNYRHLILDYMADVRIAKYIFTNTILVIPPDSRPLAKLNNQYQAHPITAAYTEILKNKKSSFLDKIFKSNAPGFGQTVYKYQNSVNKLYNEIINKSFQKKESIVRESLAGKTVETSQRAVIIPEPILRPGSVAMHEETVIKIFQPELLHFLNKKLDEENNEDYTITEFIRQVHDQIDASGNVVIGKALFKEFLRIVGPELRMLIERPPVLWRYNISGAKLGLVYFENDHKGVKQNRVMGVNSLIATMFNLDYDGDNLSAYALTSEQAKAAFHHYYMENSVEFDHNRSLIASPEHESIYAAYMLSYMALKPLTEDEPIIEIESLDGFEVDISMLNNKANVLVQLKNTNWILPYNVMVINKALGTGKILYDGTYLLKKSNVKKLMSLLRDEVKDKNFYKYLHEFNKFLLECSTIIQACNPTFDLDDFAIGNTKISDYKDTLISEPFIAFHQNEILFSSYVMPALEENEDNILKHVRASNARVKNVQLLKAIGNNGIPTNVYGKAFKKNIKNSLLDGLSKKEFFMGGDSARVALAQRQEAIPKGGELQRKFFYSTGFLKLSDVDDCGSTKGKDILIKNAHHLESLYGRFYMDGTLIDVDDKSLIGTTVTLRTPIHCKVPDHKFCTKCFGIKKPQSSSLGASIGAYISESIIQSVLRTHHFSGAFITQLNPRLLELIKSLAFSEGNKVSGDESLIKELEELLHSDQFYGESDSIEFVKHDNYYEIVQHDLPFNDDSVKQLNNIVGMIDKNREGDTLISIDEMYDFLLENIVLPNDILSVYIELVMSILFYDEDGIMIRYSDKEVDHQIALKRVIDYLDPKLAIFHNFSNKAINRIYTTKVKHSLDHMYSSLIDCYH